MSDEKNELEGLEEASFADLDSLSDFVEIDDLTTLEGMEEFIDLPDLNGIKEFSDLSDEGDVAASLSETDGMAEEIPLPALDEVAENMPLSEMVGETDEISLPELDGMTDEIPLPELEEETEEIPVPEPDGMTDEIPLPEPEEETEEIPVPGLDGIADEIPLPEPEEETEEIPVPELDGIADEIPLPEMMEENAEISVPEAGDVSDGIRELTSDVGGEEILDRESESNLDNMLDGLLDNLDMTGSIPEEAGMVSEGDQKDEVADLFDLLDEDAVPAEIDDVLDIGLPEQGEVQEPQEEQPGLIKKLFGNIVTDEIAEAERKAMEEEKAVAAEKAESDAKRKEERAAAKAAKAEQRAAAKAERKAAKQAEKEAKAEEKAKKAAEEAEEEQFEVTGKLNKAGVAIIAVLTVVFLVTEIVGTNIHSIHHTRKEANAYFDLGKYTQAYQEILGTNLQKKDPDTYNKVKTVMQVQRSINAYQNYNEMNYYPEALNSLLRGVQRYDANLETARELDVVSDMDACREQILRLLQSEFGISESDAYTLLALDQQQYTTKVVQLAMSKH